MSDQSLAETPSDAALAADVMEPADFRGLHYPLGRWTPEPGVLHPVADGVFWLRMPMPFSLNHINLWVLDDGDAWVIVDSGLQVPSCKDVWRQVLEGPLKSKPVSRMIVTHYHPDHLGLAGWLIKKTGAPLFITRTEFLLAKTLMLDAQASVPDDVLRFYARAGWDDAALEAMKGRGWGNFGRAVAPLPNGFNRLQHGQVLKIGGRDWVIHVGRGHAPEHACLICPEAGVMISGDQVLPRITSNVSVYPLEPENDPLADWMESLHDLFGLPEDLLVLPSHNEPFKGLHIRAQQLLDHHQGKLDRLADFCRAQPRRVRDTFPTLFGKALGDGEIMMATGEALAHLHYLEGKGVLHRDNSGAFDLFNAA
jgi:glyoxylase-like metal-dependent hydrolase (beta-lactamase superfamily II)